jgi:carbon-monoxide dehydrogenase iron sulfur subunit
MKELLINIEKCVACKSCEIACRTEHSVHKNFLKAVFEDNLPQKRIFVEKSFSKNVYAVPIQCRNCEDSPCITACMTGAMYKDERGVTVCDEFRCVGCFMCVSVCPFGIIVKHRVERRVVKCDRCPESDVPACVKACPTKALVFEEPDNFAIDKRKGFITGLNKI